MPYWKKLINILFLIATAAMAAACARSDDGARFGVNLIPHTIEATTFKDRRVGDAVNIEVDLIARYVERLLRG